MRTALFLVASLISVPAFAATTSDDEFTFETPVTTTATPAATPTTEDESSLASSDDDDDLDVGTLTKGTPTAADKKKKDATSTTPTLGTDEDEPEDEEGGLQDLGDDPPAVLGDLEAESAHTVAQPHMPGPIDLDVAGKSPLADNYALNVVAIDRDAVVVELPVLVASSRASVTTGFQLIGEVYVGTTKVGEVRQVVMPTSLAEFGPSFAFLKVSAPVVEKAGEVKIVVKEAAMDGSAAKELFTRVTPYQLH